MHEIHSLTATTERETRTSSVIPLLGPRARANPPLLLGSWALTPLNRLLWRKRRKPTNTTFTHTPHGKGERD